MITAFFSIVIVAAAVFSIMRGFRSGLARQTGKALGCSFGIVAARAFGSQIEGWFEPAMVWLPNLDPGAAFVVSTFSAAIPFVLAYLLVGSLGMVLSYVMRLMPVSSLGRVAGAIVALFNAMVWISLGLNLLLCRGARDVLLNTACAGDGNLIEEVMLLSPALLGARNCDDLFHAIQLDDAKRISLAPQPCMREDCYTGADFGFEIIKTQS